VINDYNNYNKMILSERRALLYTLIPLKGGERAMHHVHFTSSLGGLEIGKMS